MVDANLYLLLEPFIVGKHLSYRFLDEVVGATSGCHGKFRQFGVLLGEQMDFHVIRVRKMNALSQAAQDRLPFLRISRNMIRMERNSPVLDALVSKTKQRLLATILMRPDRTWYLSELARELQVPPSSLQRELSQFVKAGIVTRTEDGNRVYFQADPACPVFDELSRLIAKTAGLADLVREILEPFKTKIAVAFIYGSVAAGKERSSSDVDIMLVGQVNMADLAVPLRTLEERLGRVVNPTVYTSEEFVKRILRGNHFLTAVLKTELLFILGSSDDVARLVKRAKSKAA